jgi:Ran GTPase-activating protein (RanGAP) involved in mRNA processing and transport
VVASRPVGSDARPGSALHRLATDSLMLELLHLSPDEQQKMLAQQYKHRMHDPEAKFFPNLFRFIAQRQEMDMLYTKHFPTKRVEGVAEVFGDTLQYEMKTADAEQLVETQRGLYALAFQAKPIFDKELRRIMKTLGLDDNAHLLRAEVKGTAEGCVVRNKELIKMVPRVMHKAEHFDKLVGKGKLRGTGMAHVDDIVRATALGNSEADILNIIKEVQNSKKLEIVRLRNHFREDRLTPTHYRRVDLVLRLTVDSTAGLTHACELIVTTETIKENEPPSQLYDYFRGLLQEGQTAGQKGGGGSRRDSSSGGGGGGGDGGIRADRFADSIVVGGGGLMSESEEWSIFQQRMKLLQHVVQVPMLMSLLIVAMSGKKTDGGDNANEDEDEDMFSGVEVPVMPASEAATYSLAISNLIARSKSALLGKARTALQQVAAFAHAEQLADISEEQLAKSLIGTQVLLWWQRLYGHSDGDGRSQRTRTQSISGGQALDSSLRTRDKYSGLGAVRRTAWGGAEIPCFEIENSIGDSLQFRIRHRMLQEHLTAEAFVDFISTKRRRADFNTPLFGWFEGSEAQAAILNDGGYSHVLHLASALAPTNVIASEAFTKPGERKACGKEVVGAVPISSRMFDGGKVILRNCGMTDGGVGRLACFFNKTVVELDLSSNDLGGQTALVLAESFEARALPELKTLILRGNQLGELNLPLGWTHHRDAAPPWRYQHLDGRRSPTPPSGSVPTDLVSLSAAMRKVTSLTNIDLRCNTLDIEGCRKLTTGCAENFITAITASFHQEGSLNLAITSLARFSEIPVWSLSKSMITDLDLSDKELGPFEAVILTHFLSEQNALLKLDVSRNLIGPDGTLSLVKTFKTNPTLRYVNVLGNSFGATQAKKLMALLEPSTGKEAKGPALATCCGIRNQLKLSFAGYGLEAACMKVLSTELKSSQVLVSLDLSDNNLGSEGTKHLAGVIKRYLNTLKHLDLSRNAITGNGAKHLAEALPSAGGLTELKLAGNTFGTWGATILAKALSQKAHLEVITFGGPLVATDGGSGSSPPAAGTASSSSSGSGPPSSRLEAKVFAMRASDKCATIGAGFDMSSIIIFGGFVSKCKQMLRLEIAPRLLAVDVAAQLAKEIAEHMPQVEEICLTRPNPVESSSLSPRSADGGSASGPPGAMLQRRPLVVTTSTSNLTVTVAGGTTGFGPQGALLLAAFLPRCASSLAVVKFSGDGGKSGAEGEEVSVNMQTAAALDLSSARVGSSGALLLGGMLPLCSSITALDLSGNNLVGTRWDESLWQYQPVFDGVKKLGAALKKSTALTQLDLSHSVPVSGDTEYDQGPEFGSIIYTAMRSNNSITVVNMLHNGIGMRQAARFTGLLALKEKLVSVAGLDWTAQKAVDLNLGLGIGIVGAQTIPPSDESAEGGVLGAGLGALLPASRTASTRGQGRDTVIRPDDVALLLADVTAGLQGLPDPGARKLTEIKLTYGGTDGVPLDGLKKACSSKGIVLAASAPNVIAPPKKGKKR